MAAETPGNPRGTHWAAGAFEKMFPLWIVFLWGRPGWVGQLHVLRRTLHSTLLNTNEEGCQGAKVNSQGWQWGACWAIWASYQITWHLHYLTKWHVSECSPGGSSWLGWTPCFLFKVLVGVEYNRAVTRLKNYSENCILIAFRKLNAWVIRILSCNTCSNILLCALHSYGVSWWIVKGRNKNRARRERGG